MVAFVVRVACGDFGQGHFIASASVETMETIKKEMT
jgi:hypothetical protein